MTEDAVALLSEARRAWHLKRAAESQLARLRTYRQLSPSMKRDRDRHLADLHLAESALTRILGVMA